MPHILAALQSLLPKLTGSRVRLLAIRLISDSSRVNRAGIHSDIIGTPSKGITRRILPGLYPVGMLAT